MIYDERYYDWIPLNKRDKLSLGHLMAVASANLIPRLLMNIAFSYFHPLCLTIGIDSISNLLLLFGSIIDFFFTPFFGSISDGVMLKLGRRRIFIIIGTIIALISLSLLIFCQTFGSLYKEEFLAKKVILILSIELLFASITLIQSPARALCSDITPHNQQNLMSHVCQFFIGFAPILPNILYGINVHLSKITPAELFLIINVIMSIIALIVSCIAGREEPLHEKPSTVNPFRHMANAFKEMPKPLYRILLPYLFANAALFQFLYKFTEFMGSYIFQTEYSLEKGQLDYKLFSDGICFGMLCMAVNNGCQLIYSFINYIIVKKFGIKWTFLVGNAILSIMLLLFILFRQKYAYMLIAGIIGICQVIVNAIPTAIASIVIHTEDLGINLGVLNSIGLIGQQISNLAYAALISVSVSKHRPKYLIGFSSVFGLIATLLSLFVIEPTPVETDNYSEINDEAGYNGFSMID